MISSVRLSFTLKVAYALRSVADLQGSSDQLINACAAGMYMNIAEEDRLVFELAMATSQSEAAVHHAQAKLETDISQNTFNLARAEEIFLTVVDNAVYRHFATFKQGRLAVVLFPKALRHYFAQEICRKFVSEHGGVESQRPMRTGILARLIGK